VIVCDDCSNDGVTDTYLESLLPNITLIRNDKNLGFIKSANKLLSASKSDTVILMNNDCIVYDNWIDQILNEFKKDTHIGLVGTKGRFIRIEDKIYPIAVMFECVAIQRELIEKIGMLDERYGFGYYDDDDYCLRALIAGFGFGIVQQPKVMHDNPASSFGIDRRNELMKHNVKVFIDKWQHEDKAKSYISLALFNPYRWKQGFTEEELKEID
jgi:GT2 family glycosyltransferase